MKNLYSEFSHDQLQHLEVLIEKSIRLTEQVIVGCQPEHYQQFADLLANDQARLEKVRAEIALRGLK